MSETITATAQLRSDIYRVMPVCTSTCLVVYLINKKAWDYAPWWHGAGEVEAGKVACDAAGGEENGPCLASGQCVQAGQFQGAGERGGAVGREMVTRRRVVQTQLERAAGGLCIVAAGAAAGRHTQCVQ